jgi:hypothetical protein
LPAIALAQFNDHDGHLVVTWSAPNTGNPLDHYIWSYKINGVADSLTGSSTATDTLNSAVNLAHIGDWAIFKIRAISIFSDTSTTVYSDTAYYNPEQGIGPPRGVNWRGP